MNSKQIWRVLAASVAGVSHRERDLPCQDAHTIRALSDGTLLIAAADGAGSAARSAEGAALAVTQALAAVETALAHEAVAERDWRTIMESAFRTARAAIEATAATGSSPLRDFHTTLTCVVATDANLIVGQIGDGAVVARDGDAELFTAIRPQRGEYANQAYFLTMDESLDWLEVVVHPHPVSAVAVTTDGLLRLVLRLPDCAPHPAFFQPLLSFVAEAEDRELAAAELAAFLDSERVCRRTDDDKTLVLAVRTGSDPPDPADQETQSEAEDDVLGGDQP
jgi:hypothetical protein